MPAHLRELAGHGERVFILGRPPRTTALLAAVEGVEAKTYLDGHFPVIHLDGQAVTWAASWFGEGDYRPGDCYTVWAALRAILGELWRGNRVEMMLTPATTGRDLWVRTVPAGVEYPVLPHHLQTAIRAGAGQGRIETMPARSTLVTLHEYDARLAYLATTRRMPVGLPMELDTPAEAEAFAHRNPYQPARYLVTFSVPNDWGHRPGILPMPAGLAGWSWPTERKVTHGPTWVDAAELWVARNYGWSVGVLKAYAWTQTADVFRTWQTRLLRALQLGADQFAGNPTQAAMFRSAIRAMALHAIGAMHGAPHRVTGIGSVPPGDAQGIRMLGNGSWTWWTNRPPAWPQLVHPEWTTTIWGRARQRLLTTGRDGVGALHLPAGVDVVAFRTDAIYTTGPTGWDELDDGAPGRYRLKGTHGPVPWPRTGTDVLAAKAAN